MRGEVKQQRQYYQISKSATISIGYDCANTSRKDVGCLLSDLIRGYVQHLKCAGAHRGLLHYDHPSNVKLAPTLWLPSLSFCVSKEEPSPNVIPGFTLML